MHPGRAIAAACVLWVCVGAVPAQGAVATDEMISCAALGPKRPGSAADRTMGDVIINRFRAGGLQTSTEDFHLPVWRPSHVSLTITGGPGTGTVIPAESFSYSGTGSPATQIVDLGNGMPSDYTGKDVRGKIVLVDNGGAYHRTVQVEQIMSRGGVGMIYISGSPKNLIQTGAVRWGQRPPAQIPAVTIGSGTGAQLRTQLAKGAVTAALNVQGERVDVKTRNVIGIRKGTTYPDKYIVVAGHYDSWYSGANDNCSAVGTLLSTVAADKDVTPAYSMIYIGWGAEEPGLVGSYTWIWRHQDLVAKTALNINLEETASAAFKDGIATSSPSATLTFGTTSPAVMGLTIAAAGTNLVIPPIVAPIIAERAVSGGIIATDIEGFYAQGVQGVSTASASPYYHTTGDTSDTVNLNDLEHVSAYIRDLTRSAQLVPPPGLTLREVPKVTISAPTHAAAGAAIPVIVTVKDPLGQPISADRLLMLADQRDNWAVTESVAQSIGGGRYKWTLPAGMTDAGITRIRATTSTAAYLADGFATVDQTKGGLLGVSGICRPHHIINLQVPRRLGDSRTVKSLRATVSSGHVGVKRSANGYTLRLDLRRARKGAVALRLASTTDEGDLDQTRTYRDCLPVGY